MLYFSSLLKTNPQYSASAQNLFAALDSCGLRYGFVEHTKDIWLRDFMPVQRKDGTYISFRYEPSYLSDTPELRTVFRQDIAAQLDISVMYSNINLDGGNVVFSPSKGKAIISDRVFSENPGYGRAALVRKLEELLSAQVIIIPSLPSDMTGHADGMVRFVDNNTVVGNATGCQNGLEQRIKEVLVRHGINTIDFPYYSASGVSAEGCYLNYLETYDHIFLPVFGSDVDREAIQRAEDIFSGKVVPVQVREIAKNGGCLNCVSWEQDSTK